MTKPATTASPKTIHNWAASRKEKQGGGYGQSQDLPHKPSPPLGLPYLVKASS